MTIQDWIDALLSGDYQQTRKRLRDSNGFCCLGVACDVENPLLWQEYNRFIDNTIIYSWDNDGYKETHSLPYKIRTQLGLSDGQITSLVEMNDSNKTFVEIAEKIKEYAEGK